MTAIFRCDQILAFARSQFMNIDIFAEHFSELEDPRQASKVVYPLFDVVFLTLCAVIAGCEGWEDIEDFGENRCSSIHMVSAFASANGVVMGQVKTDEKSNEITAIPQLLNLLELKGCLVSLDAMGCQKEIAQQIVDKEADYLLTVKGNQGQLHDAVKQVFAGKAHKDTAAQSLEKNRGRLEYREFQVCDASELPEKLKAAWPALTTLGMATTYRVEKDKRAVLEQRYFISSAALSAERLSSAVREHWSIENQLHWVLDVSLGEDACQIYRGNAATNLATMRHFGLNMLRAEKRKMSIRRKQRQALMNEAYLDAVLEACMGMVIK
ncbi:H repeat-associated protein yhhI [Alishewanella aestuarii B11]|uniref:H repeat-associated protein yhhI n=2 Tax=Alishewanella aestuarii TaxID=453835 RepID=J2IGR0_9ALTE|nr:H repeat-associated protein yhhI [Alishewanella aestuarii B11]